MINIDIQPKEIDFSGNPLALSVYSDNYILIAGSAAYLNLTKGGTLTGGDSFIISFLDYDLTFRVGTGATDDGLYIPTAATIDQLLEYLNYNYLLTKYYEVTKTSSTRIKCLSKEKGTVYNILANVTGCAALTKDEIAGVNRSVQTNFKIFWQIYFKHKYMIAYDSMPEQFIDVDDDGEAIIPINKILRLFWDTIELPDFNSGFLQEGRETLYLYYLKLAEYYGTTPAVKKLTSSDVMYALNGKLPFDKFPGHDFYNDLAINQMFLTNQAQPIETYKAAQQFLTWINPGGTIDTLGLLVQIWITSSPNPIGYAFVKDWFYNVANKDVLIAPAGHDQLGLSIVGDVRKYKVYLAALFDEFPPEQVSEAIEFKVVPEPVFAKQFLYKNDFGVYETLIAEKVQNKFEIETKVFEKDLEYNYQLPDGEMAVITENAYNKFTVRTGTMTKAAADHLCEMLSNNDVYIIGKLQFVPVIIEKGTVELSDEADDIFTVKFEYRYTINGKLSEDA